MILETIDGTMTALVYEDILKKRLLRNFPALSPYTVQGAELDSGERLIFQQDGARVHKANNVLKYFHERDIEILEFPPKSPDLNLIEGVWDELKAQLKRSYKDPQELLEDIFRNWNNITMDYIQILYDSMKDRVRKVYETKGGPTDY